MPPAYRILRRNRGLPLRRHQGRVVGQTDGMLDSYMSDYVLADLALNDEDPPIARRAFHIWRFSLTFYPYPLMIWPSALTPGRPLTRVQGVNTGHFPCFDYSKFSSHTKFTNAHEAVRGRNHRTQFRLQNVFGTPLFGHAPDENGALFCSRRGRENKWTSP